MDTINALGGMLNIPQWFVWRLTWDQEENKFQKVPCYPDGSKYRMDAQDPSNWQTFANARASLAVLRQRNDGHAYTLGFWLTADTGYWFFDIDKCVSAGQLTPLAQQLTAGFNGAAWEWSSSGTGLHIFGRGVIPEHRRKDAHRANLEFYHDKRGIAFGLSGQFFGNADTDHSGAVRWLVDNYFPPQALPGEVLDSAFDQPVAGYNGPADDDELIARIRRSERLDAAAVFAGLPAERATFSDLFDGNQSVLQRVYAGASDQDYALIGILSFWTGRDAVRTERIMRRSQLYRDKWESQRGKDTYIRYSILRQFRIAHSESRPVYGVTRSASEFPVGQTGNANSSTVSAGDTAVVGNDARQSYNNADVPTLITVTYADPAKREAVKAAQDAFARAGDQFELEAAALNARTIDALDDGAREGLAHELMRRFEQLQSKRKISHCRMLLASDLPQLQAGQHRECTEFGNVERMIDRVGRSLMYVTELEQWYKWDESQWRDTTAEEVAFLASETIYAIAEEARNEQNEEMRAKLMGWAMDSQKASMVASMVRVLKTKPQVFARANTLDTDLSVMGTPNGAIDLHTGALLVADPSRRITQYTRVPYDPAADCPWFKQTLREAFFDDIEMVVFFKRLMGYALLGKPNRGWLIIPYGAGANGKSTIINAIQHVLHQYAKAVPSETFTSIEGTRSGAAGAPREDLVGLRGARFLSISEIDERAKMKEAMLKTLTGGDPITARGINAKQSITYTPRFVPIMSTNHRPIIEGTDEGIWRRIMMVPFERNFKKDPNIAEDLERGAKIAMESAGVLRWLVEGAVEYQQYGVTVPAKMREANEDYKAEQDLLAEWQDRFIEFDDSSAVAATDLYASWVAYATPLGMLKLLGTQTAFGRKLKNRAGFRKAQHTHGIRGRCYIGVRLKSRAEVVFHG